MRGETKRSDEEKSSAGRRLAAATAAEPVRVIARTASDGVAALGATSLTRIRLDEEGRTIRPGLRSNGGV